VSIYSAPAGFSRNTDVTLESPKRTSGFLSVDSTSGWPSSGNLFNTGFINKVLMGFEFNEIIFLAELDTSELSQGIQRFQT